jgi:hypothetical protein
MKIKTIQNLISAIKREIDSLLVNKASIEERINQLSEELLDLKESFNNELDLARREMIFGFDMGEFIKYELHKQSLKEKEIKKLICERDSLLEAIVEKNTTKKKYEHLIDQIVSEENKKLEKIEVESLDSYSTSRFYLISQET